MSNGADGDMSDRPAAPRRARAKAATGTIRPYRAEDREAVRDICRRTAYRNRGYQAAFEDGELFADYWCNYYTDHEPESCLVLEEDGKVVGYLFGTTDAGRFVRTMGRSIVPKVVGTALWRLATFQYREPVTRRMLWWLATRSWKEAPRVPLDRFPAHYHCNLLRQAYGKSYYTSMAVTFLDRLKELGVDRIHGQVEEPAEGGPWRNMVTAYHAATGTDWSMLEVFDEKPSTFPAYVLGVDKPMVNRVWGSKVQTYRDWLVWTGERFHM